MKASDIKSAPQQTVIAGKTVTVSYSTLTKMYSAIVANAVIATATALSTLLRKVRRTLQLPTLDAAAKAAVAAGVRSALNKAGKASMKDFYSWVKNN